MKTAPRGYSTVGDGEAAVDDSAVFFSESAALAWANVIVWWNKSPALMLHRYRWDSDVLPLVNLVSPLTSHS